MPDIIQLLPDSLANQIAAGEVIQRPASVVKELLENAVDAKSTEIKLILKNSGKTLIQVVDNGIGMSLMDARMSFERHATSKLKKTSDLFNIRTKGFRGEALASLAAVAQVELKTRQEDDAIGSHIKLSGSKLQLQDPLSCPVGSNFAVKNLFFNVPARRKFLKSDPVELKHILEEFIRLALPHPEIQFSCFHNEQKLYHLESGHLRQRVLQLFGKLVNEKILPIDEETDFIRISGFVGKPDFVKKKNHQYIFVNKRFIKSRYLNHAIKSAFESLIPYDQYPFYVIDLEIDPSKVDINVHPTKQEVKFDEERLIYNYLKVAVKHGLGKYSLTPTIDFDREASPSMDNSGTMSPSGSSTFTNTRPSSGDIRQWEDIYKNIQPDFSNYQSQAEAPLSPTSSDDSELNLSHSSPRPFQIHNTYIACQIKTGLMLIDQQAAHERILYEKNLEAMDRSENLIQQELFPQTVELTTDQSETMKSILPKIQHLGFQIEEFGNNTFVVHGVPSNLPAGTNVKSLIETFIVQYMSNLEFQLGIDENVARSLAVNTSIKRGEILKAEEMQSIVDQLFACSIPNKSPLGKTCVVTLSLEEIEKKFSS